MADLWLDDLSEDWPTQDDSLPDFINHHHVQIQKSMTSSTNSINSKYHNSTSRIPLRNTTGRSHSITSVRNDNDILPLGERSANLSNLVPSHRPSPTIASHSDKHDSRGRKSSRLPSPSSIAYGSVIRNTPLQKSLSSSPVKSNRSGGTPHSKSYFQPPLDLFSTGAPGFLNLFQPPDDSSRPDYGAAREVIDDYDRSSMPSSPPQYAFNHLQQDKHEDSNSRGTSLSPRRNQPRNIQYRLVDQEADQSSFNELELSQSSYIRPGASLNQSMSQRPVIHEVALPILSRTRSSPPQTESSVCHDSSLLDVGGTTRMSGQSEVRHEGLSPIYLTKHNMSDGDVSYAPISDIPSERQKQESQDDVDNIADELLESFIIDGEDDGDISCTPRDGDTNDYAHDGHFVQVGRGSNQNEASFQPVQSLRAHATINPLSTPKVIESNSTEIKTQPIATTDSKARDTQCKPNGTLDPGVDHESGQGSRPSTARPGSGGSPLKLFGIHDTFTNHKLQRTLSNIECNMSSHSNTDSSHNQPVELSGHGDEGLNTPQNQKRSSPPVLSPILVDMNTRSKEVIFGQGVLDTFEFGEDVSNDSNLYSDTENNSSSLRADSSTEHGIFKFRMDNGTLSRNSLPKRRARVLNTSEQRLARPRSARKASISSSNSPMDVHVIQRTEIFTTPHKEISDSQIENDILRSPYSPIKDPTPKRRRTLHRGDIGYDGTDLMTEVFSESQQYTSTTLGKKRKDARQGEIQMSAEPSIMAMRTVLTPQRMGSSLYKIKPVIANQHATSKLQTSYLTDPKSQEKLNQIQAELDDIRNPVIPIDAKTEVNQRQPSVTTADFLTDAVNVMAALRQYVRKPELNQMSRNECEDDNSIDESTIEPLSRPASRAGAPLRRPAHLEQNLEHLDHLQKFQDTNDVDNLTLSMKSYASQKDLNTANDPGPALQSHNVILEMASRSSENCDIGSRRQQDERSPTIDAPLQQELAQRKRKYSSSSVPCASLNANVYTLHSVSSEPSTNRTGTSSVRLGDNVKVIPSAKVSHLIPEKLKGMVYDRERNAWLKEKCENAEKAAMLDETEMDPFEDIPDLTVDETREQARLSAFEAPTRNCSHQEYFDDVSSSGTVDHHECRPDETASPGSNYEDNEHATSDNMSSQFENALDPVESTPSKWSRRQQPIGEDSEYMEHSSDDDNGRSTVYDGVELPQQRHNNNDRSTPEDSSNRQSVYKRKVTISFSSPIASIIEPGQLMDGFERPTTLGSARKQIVSSMKRSLKSRAHVLPDFSSPEHGSARKNSSNGLQFGPRPVSRIDEEDEESFLECVESQAKDRVLSLVVTPTQQRVVSRAVSVIKTPIMHIVHDSLLNLTPLSDFTVHQKDTSFAFETSAVGRGCQIGKIHNTRTKSRSLSLSIDNLVKNITDVEQHEPYWEHMKALSLKARRLQALHMLNEFCPNLEEFNAADNEIHHLDGAPPLLRRLDISHNILSDLTSWKSLQNLQYLDISNNDLSTLEGFKDLVHLRYLKADNNKITSLDGITHLDGLSEVRLRGNAISQIDFDNSDLRRLVSLDLKGNMVHSVVNLSKVPGLVNLNLEDNKIHTIQSSENCPELRLKYLKLSHNQIEQLDVSNYTNLRILYLDHNRLQSLRGLRSIKHLDSLSLREQHPETLLSKSILDEACEVRKLFLSGNYLGTFDMDMPYLNLQYLELASCGIMELPRDFFAKLPNLRILNINFNAIANLKPLVGLTRLKTLHASGNRLVHVRKTSYHLSKVPTLRMLDLRNNPMTLGFYQPHCEKRLSYEERHEEIGKIEPWMMEDGHRAKDIAWENRLDLGTAIERRIYELKVVTHCSSLQMLDGLVIDKMALGRKDRVSMKMAEEGLLMFAKAPTMNAQDEVQVQETSTDHIDDGSQEQK